MNLATTQTKRQGNYSRCGGAFRYRLLPALQRAYRTPAGWSWATGLATDGTRLFAAWEPDGQISVSREEPNPRNRRGLCRDYCYVPALVSVPDDDPLLLGAWWCPMRGDDERGPAKDAPEGERNDPR